jgi:hypothetical protein
MRRPAALGAFLCGVAACSHGASTPWRGAASDEWPSLQAELAHLREAPRQQPWSAGLHAAMRLPREGRTLDARGAIAVAPGRALRLILIAGAGTTMLDAWVTRDRWRIAVPPASLVRRGGNDEPNDLPIGFLRWWFFRPLAGALFAASHADAARGPGDVFLLRDGDGATIELRAGPCLRASRRAGARTERVEDCSTHAGQPGSGDRVRYEDEASGLTVDLQLESLTTAPPDEGAFRDPDAPSGDG